jgi:hypothetical protein
VGLTKVGNQAKSQNYSEKSKVVYLTNLKQMFERTATDLDIEPTPKQQILTCAFKIGRLLPDDCCYLNDTGNEILFRINW